jgi:hypothetical protein
VNDPDWLGGEARDEPDVRGGCQVSLMVTMLTIIRLKG